MHSGAATCIAYDSDNVHVATTGEDSALNLLHIGHDKPVWSVGKVVCVENLHGIVQDLT